MGQYEVYDFLEANIGKWFTTRQVTETMGLSKCVVSRAMHKLMRGRLIQCRIAVIRRDNGNQKNYIWMSYSACLTGHRIPEYSSRKTKEKDEREVEDGFV